MKNFRIALSLLIIALLAQPVFALNDVVSVSIQEIRPTQPAAGLASTEIIRKSKYSKLASMEDYLAKIVSENPLRAVRGPDGAVYLTDGHHRALAIYSTSMEKCEAAKPADGVDACMKKARVQMKIEADYSKSDWDTFLDELRINNNIYLPAEVWGKVKKGEISKEQIFKNPGGILPANVGKLANNPARSALGNLFSRQKFNIDSNNFVNYFEFFLAEKIADKVTVLSGQEFTPEVQINLARALFYTPDVLNYMRCLARLDDFSWDKAQTDINLALRIEANTPFDQENCN